MKALVTNVFSYWKIGCCKLCISLIFIIENRVLTYISHDGDSEYI